MKFILMLMLVIGLAGCPQKSTVLSTDQQGSVACASFASSMDALSVANDAGKLTAVQQKAVIKYAGEVLPFCTGDHPPTVDDAKNRGMIVAVQQLELLAAKYLTHK